jgi:hypothetical protein
MAEIPQRVQQFIASYIFSLSELEILLYLRDHASEKCSAETIGRNLLMHRPAAEPRLEALRVCGLVSAVEIQGVRYYQYAPAKEMDAIIDDLARWYKSHPVAVTTLIFSKPIDNIIRGFADSFRLRKKEDEGRCVGLHCEACEYRSIAVAVAGVVVPLNCVLVPWRLCVL